MSIALMTLAWKASFPSGKKLILLALCDNANDQGECYPSISMLAEKCSMSERSVFNQIADLEKDGAIVRNTRAGRSTVYQINPCKFCTPTPATVAPLPLQRLHPTPATVAPTPATVAPITITKPSINHQIEPNTKTRTAAPAFVLPDWISSDAWAAFMVVRKNKKAASTDYALGLIVKTLEKIRADGHDAIDALNKSIKAGWSDVYPPKAEQQFAGQPINRQEALEQRNRAVANRWASGSKFAGAI